MIRKVITFILVFLPLAVYRAERPVITYEFLESHRWVRPLNEWGFEIHFRPGHTFEVSLAAEGGEAVTMGHYTVYEQTIHLEHSGCNINEAEFGFCATECRYDAGSQFWYYSAGLVCQPGNLLFADSSSERPLGGYFYINGIKSRYLGDRSFTLKENLALWRSLATQSLPIDYHCQYDECPEGKERISYLPAGTTVRVRAISADNHTVNGITARWFYVEAPVSHALNANGWIQSNLHSKD